MAIDFSKFDKQVDLEGLKKDIEDSSSNDFKEVPLVIVDRDRIYEKGKSYIKQLREGY